MNVLPNPRSLRLSPGAFTLPRRGTISLDSSDADLLPGAKRLRAVAGEIGVELVFASGRPSSATSGGRGKPGNPPAIRAIRLPLDEAAVAASRGARVPWNEFYALTISKSGIEIFFCEAPGFRAAVATLRQLLRQFGRRLPCLNLRDWPDFPRRGVMLDVSRGRVPKLETLLDLAGRLADFKINELQLYTEHTFAYRRHPSVWRRWSALTGAEIRRLDARCRELGIDLVPNQNSFGHLRQFLEEPKLRKLAEVPAPYEDDSGEFVRRPSTLAPRHPGALRFLRGLYDELLPNFTSRFFNVGCDETWDLGRGQSQTLCARLGKGRVYLEFLKKIHREVSARGRTMMFWGDIVLSYPELIPELARMGGANLPVGADARQGVRPGNLIALNWGYEANHPFAKEAARFAEAKIPFYVCPGTSSWQTLIGRHDNALANLRRAADAGRKFGAAGYLIADWGDGGHPQPLAVSWPMLLAGAALAWNAKNFDERKLVPVVSRDVFGDASGRIAAAAFNLGFVHRTLGVSAPNETPLGTVIAAPPPEQRELFCRNGLKWFDKIPARRIRAALRQIEKQRALLRAGLKPNLAVRQPGALRQPAVGGPRVWAASCRPKRAGSPFHLWRLARELDLAARMAAQSCRFMLWQQTRAAGRTAEARRLAARGILELEALAKDFDEFWPLRNKGTARNCAAFLRWRLADCRRG